MNRTLRRRLARAKKLCAGEAEPDPAGMEGQEWLLWAMNKYGLEELVMQSYAASGEPNPAMRDDAGRGASAREATASEASEVRVEAMPAVVEIKETPAEPKPEPQWWEEKCRWREPGARALYDDGSLDERDGELSDLS